MTFYECERVTLAGIERPVRFMLETHSNLQPPEACAQGDWNLYRILHAVWTNDTHFSEAVGSAWNITAHVVDLRHEVADGSESWAWGSNRLEKSVTADEALQSATNFRYAWGVAGGVYLMDLAESSYLPQQQLPLVTGEVHPPLLVSDRSTRFIGEGGSASATLEGRLSRFSDPLCASPVPP